MNTDLLVIALNMALLVGLWWLWFVGYRNYLVDRTRQDLFRIRDDLFDRAKAGEIGFDAEAYKVTRATLNGMIHYTHELSAIRLLLTLPTLRAAARKGYAHKFSVHLEQAKTSLTPAQRILIEKTFEDMHKVTLRHLRDGSLVLRAMVLVVKLVHAGVRHTLLRGFPLVVSLVGRGRKERSVLSTRMDADANLIATPAASRQRKLTTFPV